MNDDAKRPVGRPAIGPRVTVHLPAELIEEVDRDAEATGTTRAGLIRELIEATYQEVRQ